ncbi:similar to Saccharomyces cerevisiae YHR084W STE12 Transcription factor that is activated by a MAP kinase signaling cascade [Maudiozyma saulgeensis]|uniref:Similar to Saccharomyces cerevisiae YHR084W STE12 Transcription factor that is activated by a MAP kinase signaling cascade n=1 Tax=Maudiozyma saulgeensis TaxID=1789683 RepID=A0A1X7R210_9SACH|nr:similar to Saccharomyces cerevisiae YHR084W STE12 Transcription factor that is activated by a MAP kinase signaling cascade [Kazachstania saulgeensis]
MVTSFNNRTQTILKADQHDGGSPHQSNPEEVEESIKLIEDFKYYLTTGPANWQENQIIRRYHLNNELGFVSCVFWNNLYYMTGTDIVKCCLYRMEKFGRIIVQKKKFEEGIFSDLRNLKIGTDATLEQPKSEFLQFLLKNSCLKTQKKQKVFFWFSIPHDKLLYDALERDLKRESSGQEPTTKAVNEPALSFEYISNNNKSFSQQILRHIERFKEQFEKPKTGITDMPPEYSTLTPPSATHLKKEPGLESINEVNDHPQEVTCNKNSQEVTEQNMLETSTEQDSKPTLTTTDEALNSSSLDNAGVEPFLKNTQNTATIDDEIPSEFLNFDIEYPKGYNNTKDDIKKEDYNTLNPTNYKEGQEYLSMYQMASPYVSKPRGSITNGIPRAKDLEGREDKSSHDIKQEIDPTLNNPVYHNNQMMTSQVLYTQPKTLTPNYNMMQPPVSAFNPFAPDIIAQSLEQPLFGFEGLYSPQLPYGRDGQKRPDGIATNSMIQPQILQPPPSATLPNPFTPGFKNMTPYPWVQSPFLPLGTVMAGSPFFSQRTPTFMSNKPRQSFSTKVVQPKDASKVRKISHTGPEIAISKSKAALQNKIKENAKQLQAQIEKK